MDTIVLDIETKNMFRDIGRDKSNFPKLGVSVVGIYSYDQGNFMIFREEEFTELKSLVSHVGQIVGFNLKGFDYPVLEGHLDFDFDSVKTVDIMDDIKRVISRRISLNEVAKATLGLTKSADGIQAINFYHEGKWEELERYCLDDVKITRDLFDFGRRHKYVQIFKTFGLERRKIPVNWGLLSESLPSSPTPSSQESLF